MWTYLGRRLLVSVVTVAGIVVVVFFIMRVLPGDAAAVRAGPYASEEKLEQIREQFGLSDPVPVQFVNYVTDAVTGDLGTSIRTGGEVTEELLIRLPASLELAFYAVLLAVLAGVPVGVAAAARRDTWLDRAARVVAVLGSSMAFFWLGLILTFVFFFKLGWFPGAGRPPGHHHPATRDHHRLLHRRRGPGSRLGSGVGGLHLPGPSRGDRRVRAVGSHHQDRPLLDESRPWTLNTSAPPGPSEYPGARCCSATASATPWFPSPPP